MMTDDQILSVVSAHKEGKKIECRKPEGDWFEAFPFWDFSVYEYRVAPEPRKELWLQECTPKGLWQEKFVGLGRHFIEVEGATKGEPTVISSTVKTFDEINPLSPRKPREWNVLVSTNGDFIDSPRTGQEQLQWFCRTIRVREILE